MLLAWIEAGSTPEAFAQSAGSQPPGPPSSQVADNDGSPDEDPDAPVPNPTGDAASQCLDRHERAQRLRSEEKLRAARDELLACASPDCPQRLQSDCTQWLEQIESTMPTLVVDARDRTGFDMSAVRVTADDEVLTEALDGSAIPVDPGIYTFRFELMSPPGQASPVTRKVIVRAGEKNRLLEVRFDYPPPLPPIAERPVSPLIYLIGGAGLVGLGIGTVSFISARTQESTLSDRSCSPRCDPAAAEAIDTADTVAITSGAVGVGLLSTALVWYLVRPTILRTPAEEARAEGKRPFSVAPLVDTHQVGLSAVATF